MSTVSSSNLTIHSAKHYRDTHSTFDILQFDLELHNRDDRMVRVGELKASLDDDTHREWLDCSLLSDVRTFREVTDISVTPKSSSRVLAFFKMQRDDSRLNRPIKCSILVTLDGHAIPWYGISPYRKN